MLQVLQHFSKATKVAEQTLPTRLLSYNRDNIEAAKGVRQMALKYAEDEINTFLGLWSHEWERVYDGDVWAITRRDWDNIIDISVWSLGPKDHAVSESESWSGPRYTQDLHSVARIEAQLSRLQKHDDYTTILLDVLDIDDFSRLVERSALMVLATASARHRAEAAYRVLKRLF
jgi:hypothetical protein